MRRAARSGARMFGTAERPRLVVNRTNRAIYAQLIDDVKGHTIAAISTMAGKKGTKVSGTKTQQALTAGETLGKKAVEKGIKAVVFDRRSSRFHGRVKALADGAKKSGLKI